MNKSRQSACSAFSGPCSQSSRQEFSCIWHETCTILHPWDMTSLEDSLYHSNYGLTDNYMIGVLRLQLELVMAIGLHLPVLSGKLDSYGY